MSSFWWISPAIIVIGWLVVRHFQDERETRKEVRTHIAEVTTLIEKTQDQCYRYYGKAGNEDGVAEIAQDIRCKLKQAGFRAGSLAALLPKCDVMVRYIKFRQAVSLRLDDAGRPPIDAADELFEEVSNTGGNVIRCLENAFDKRFRK